MKGTLYLQNDGIDIPQIDDSELTIKRYKKATSKMGDVYMSKHSIKCDPASIDIYKHLDGKLIDFRFKHTENAIYKGSGFVKIEDCGLLIVVDGELSNE